MTLNLFESFLDAQHQRSQLVQLFNNERSRNTPKGLRDRAMTAGSPYCFLVEPHCREMQLLHV